MNRVAIALRSRWPGHLSFVCLVAATAIPSAYVVPGGYYPVHDSLLSFEHFAYVYSSFLSDWEIRTWNPYVGFGQTTDHQQIPKLAANVAFKSVLVSEGVHEVTFSIVRYERVLRFLEFAILCLAQMTVLCALALVVGKSTIQPDPRSKGTVD
jgi:hypothetical protein